VPEAATATATPYTLDGFKTEYQKTLDQYKGYGISESTFRDVNKNILLRKKVEEAITVDQPATGMQVLARHILVDDEATAKIVSDILAQGGDFAEAAKQYSKDTGSAVNGGLLGWHDANYYVGEFSAAAFSQKIGEIGQPVKSQFGYHIIQVLNRQELPLTGAQLQQSRDKSLADWLTTKRDGATITKSETWTKEMPPIPADLVIQ
jgi:parvulin-like peptidyl-prolyl isomerase